MNGIRITLRHESRPDERRAPVVPADAARLVAQGITVTVEDSPQRAFATAGYAAAGCRITEPGRWAQAPAGEFIVGLKELPAAPAALRHQHVFFGHAFKGQQAAPALLARLAAGGGALLDLEYLTDDHGRRLVTFGYWAGYAGAALAVLHQRGELAAPLAPATLAGLAAALRRPAAGARPRVLVIGALGRCGRGARDALAVAGLEPTCWDLAQTAALDRAALLDHDIVINTVLAARPAPPFLTRAALRDPGRLAVIADVSCDVSSPCNMMPVYDQATTWADPVTQAAGAGRRVDVIAIDNLPSLLPAEASAAFSAALTPHLAALGGPSPAWERCRREFRAAAATVKEPARA